MIGSPDIYPRSARAGASISSRAELRDEPIPGAGTNPFAARIEPTRGDGSNPLAGRIEPIVWPIEATRAAEGTHFSGRSKPLRVRKEANLARREEGLVGREGIASDFVGRYLVGGCAAGQGRVAGRSAGRDSRCASLVDRNEPISEPRGRATAPSPARGAGANRTHFGSRVSRHGPLTLTLPHEEGGDQKDSLSPCGRGPGRGGLRTTGDLGTALSAPGRGLTEDHSSMYVCVLLTRLLRVKAGLLDRARIATSKEFGRHA
jgi:hypothetical protein